MRRVSSQESSSSTDRVVAGRIGRPHGLAGEMSVWSESDDPSRFTAGSVVRAGGRDLVVAASRSEDGRLYLRFEGIDDREAAGALRGEVLTVDAAARRDLDEDEFWPDELVGMTVVTVAGVRVGAVVDVVTGLAQDRLVIETVDRQVEIPFVRALVPEVSRNARQVIVDPPAGLFDAVNP
jgi:16S rRNA processing protein RimM